jgi:hypothetical protein
MLETSEGGGSVLRVTPGFGVVVAFGAAVDDVQQVGCGTQQAVAEVATTARSTSAVAVVG